MLAALAAIAIRAVVAVDLPPMPLSRLVPKLGEQFGEVMACAGPLQNRVVMIRADKTSQAEVMKRLAEVVGGEWSKTSTGTILSRTPALEKRLNAEALAKRAAAIKKKFDEMNAEVAKTPVFDMAAARKYLEDLALNDAAKGDPDNDSRIPDFEMKIFNRSPANRATIKLMGMLDVVKLSSLRQGSIAYSLTPNRYQQPLPAKTAEVIKSLEQENDVWRQALLGMTEQPSSWTGGDPRMQAHAEGAPAKVILVVTVYNPIATIPVELFVANQKGELIVHSRVVVNPGFFSMRAGPLPDFTKNPDFQLSTLAKEFVAFTSLDYRTPKPPMTKEWEDRFVNPQKWEPLSFLAGEALAESAKREQVNLIAAMPDEMLQSSLAASFEAINLAAYLKTQETNCRLNVTRESGWMLVRPDEKVGPALFNIDRVAVGQFCHHLQQTGMISLDAMADIMLAMPNPDWDPVVFPYTVAIAPRLERLLQSTNQSLFKVYALLSTDQRKVVREGGFVPIDRMPEPARDALADLLRKPGMVPGGGIMKDGQSMTLADPPIDSLPSELLGNGLPIGAGITSKGALADIAVIGTLGGARYTPWTQIVEKAQFPAFLGRSMSHDPDDKRSSIWFGKRLKLQLDLAFTRGYSYRGFLEEIQVNVREKATTYADLPEETRKAIDKAAIDAAQQRQGGGNQLPPPLR